MDGFPLRGWVILVTGMTHFNADTVIVIDSWQSLEDVDVNGAQVRINCLEDCAVVQRRTEHRRVAILMNSRIRLRAQQFQECRFRSSA